jgi:rSAM/selenodomain-associated transferase 1
MRRALLIVAKAPAAGVTKTRLVPPLSADDAAALYAGFLLDCVGVGLELGWERVSVVHPHGARPALARLLPPQVCLLEQPGRGLANALSHGFSTHLAEGFVNVVLIGSDNPTLPPSLVHAASATLDAHDLTIGPTADGGYYLIGMREAHLGDFDAIDWSTPRVFQQTLDRAHRLGLSVGAVPEWYDVDEPADLERLQRELAVCPDRVAPNTRRVLDRLGRPAAIAG